MKKSMKSAKAVEVSKPVKATGVKRGDSRSKTTMKDIKPSKSC